MKTLIFLITISLFLLSCKADQVTVRLQNVSDYDFKRITVSLGDTVKSFDDLHKGIKTTKFKTNKTYGYCFTEIILTNNDTVTLWPVDYVGEKLYRRGKIKMKIDLRRNHVSKNFQIYIKTRRQL